MLFLALTKSKILYKFFVVEKLCKISLELEPMPEQEPEPEPKIFLSRSRNWSRNRTAKSLRFHNTDGKNGC